MDPKAILRKALGRNNDFPTDQIKVCLTDNHPPEEFINDMKQRQRKLSEHITTRPYRAPEVILLEKHYHKPIDIWALGIILFDMFTYLHMTPQQRKEKKPSFMKADHCFPLSEKGAIWDDDGLPSP